MVNSSAAGDARDRRPRSPRFHERGAAGTVNAMADGMNRNLLFLASFLFPLAAAGCSVESTPDPAPRELPKPSTDFTTNQIYPSTSAQDDGTNLTVFAALLSGTKFLTLGPTDRLVAKVGDGPELVLASQGETYTPHYVATLPSSKDAVDVVITLDRAGTADDAKVKLHVPSPFALDGTPPAELKAGASFQLGVTPAAVKDDTLYWALVEGTCVNPGATVLATVDQGKLGFVVPTSVFKKDAPASCDVAFRVQHIQAGKIEGAFSEPLPVDAIGLRERRFTTKLGR